MAFQPSLTRVTQKRGAKQPDKVDVGETTIPGGLSLREMDDAPTQGAEDRARPSLSETGIAPEMHSGGARPKFLPVRFHETVQGRSPDSDREPRPRLDETNPWRHASILLHTSPSSRFTRFPHQPADSPSSAIGRIPSKRGWRLEPLGGATVQLVPEGGSLLVNRCFSYPRWAVFKLMKQMGWSHFRL